MANTCNCPPLYTEATKGVCTSLIPGLPQLACNTTQNPVAQATQGVAQGSVPGLSGLVNAFSTLTSPSTWVHVGLFAVALVFLIIGMMVLATGDEQQ